MLLPFRAGPVGLLSFGIEDGEILVDIGKMACTRTTIDNVVGSEVIVLWEECLATEARWEQNGECLTPHHISATPPAFFRTIACIEVIVMIHRVTPHVLTKAITLFVAC